MAPTDAQSEILDALAHPQRRRLLLGVIEQFDGDLRADRDDGSTPDWQVELHREADRVDPLQVLGRTDVSAGSEIQLVHNHLPKLENAGLIDWDPASRTVGAGPRMDVAASILAAVRNAGDRDVEEVAPSIASGEGNQWVANDEK